MASTGEEQEVRKKLEGKIGKVTDRIWKELDEERYVDEAIQFGEPEFANLVKQAQFLRWQASSRGRPKGSKPRLGHLLDPREVARAATFARHVARCARQEYQTRRIRDAYLSDGKFLSKDEMDRFLGSVAPRFLTAKTFTDLGVPILRHASRFVDPKDPEVQPIDWSLDIVVRIQWEGGIRDIKHASLLHFDAQNTGRTFAPFGRRRVGVLSGSVFDDLQIACTELADNCDWTPQEALRFMLMDEAPSMAAIKFRETGGRRLHFAHSPFEFVIEPWVSPATVLKVYRAAQKQLFGKQAQFITERSCALFQFVMEDVTQGQKWPSICDAWNKKHRSKRTWFYSDYRNIRKDFLRIYWMIAFPGIKPPSPTARRKMNKLEEEIGQ